MFPGEVQQQQLTLFTDAYVIRGRIATHQRRVTDILNNAERPFLVLTDVTVDEYGSHAGADRADFAQVNLASVLFATSESSFEPSPELRTPKVQEEALISIPPFRILGHLHLAPESTLRDALLELTAAFVPVTAATYWSDVVAEARTSSSLVAFNRSRAQILAPHRVIDPWAGLSGGGAQTGTGSEPAAG
jgi:hypothetical protein